jgi:hypothetical protein
MRVREGKQQARLIPGGHDPAKIRLPYILLPGFRSAIGPFPTRNPTKIGEKTRMFERKAHREGVPNVGLIY